MAGPDQIPGPRGPKSAGKPGSRSGNDIEQPGIPGRSWPQPGAIPSPEPSGKHSGTTPALPGGSRGDSGNVPDWFQRKRRLGTNTNIYVLLFVGGPSLTN